MSEEKLKVIYYNPNDVRKWLEQQKPYELHKQVQKPKEFSNIYAERPLQ